MSFASQFVRPMEKEIQRKVRDVSVTLVSDISKEVFTNILNLWPVDTAWSAANHRINAGPNPQEDFPLEPPTRPTERGALLGEASQNEKEQMSKLDSLAYGDRVLIGNAVPYAGDAAGAGNGLRIYFEAGATGIALISSRIG